MTTEQIEARIAQLMEETKRVVLGYHDRYMGAFDVFEIEVIGDHDGQHALATCHYHVVDVCEKVSVAFCPGSLDDEEYFFRTATDLMIALSAPVREDAIRALFPEEYHPESSN